jgi:hypothetical protein
MFFNWALRHEGVLWKWRYSSTHSLTSAIDGCEGSASHPGRFVSSERTPGTHWIGGWMGPRAVLDAVVKRKIPSPRRESSPRTQIVQPLAQRYTDWAITALTFHNYKDKHILTLCVVRSENYVTKQLLNMRSELFVILIQFHERVTW